MALILDLYIFINVFVLLVIVLITVLFGLFSIAVFASEVAKLYFLSLFLSFNSFYYDDHASKTLIISDLLFILKDYVTSI